MSDSVPLPPRPNLEQYKKLARELQAACKSADRDALRGWIAQWSETIARLPAAEAAPVIRQRIERRWSAFTETHKRAPECRLTDAQWFLARAHGFQSWPKFARHISDLTHIDSNDTLFEAAVDAIVAGDEQALKNLLARHPELIRYRSAREHRSTLLHYVSANGVEDFRQKTPPNILSLARLLLDAGADVNAESEAYGGGSTALGLVATSLHPEKQGVQLPLLNLLIERGAQIETSQSMAVVNLCLANGRGEAAEFLANRGARLDLESACGVGRFDLVRACFDLNGSLRSPSTAKQMQDGFAWACQFGRTPVVEFLLANGMDANAPLRHHGQTGLHWAAYGGHVDTVELLLRRGARINAKDPAFDGTPLDWALHAWSERTRRDPNKDDRYLDAVRTLVRAGASPPERNAVLPSDP